MSLEHHHAEAVPGRLADRSDPGAAGLGESWGWLLVQRDPAAAWLRRLVCGAPRGAVQDSAR